MARLRLSDLHGRENLQGIISSIKGFVFYSKCKWKILKGSEINRIMFLKDHYECLEEPGFQVGNANLKSQQWATTIVQVRTKWFRPGEWSWIFLTPGLNPSLLCCRQILYRCGTGEAPRRRAWHLTPVLLLGDSQRQSNLAGYSSAGKDPNTTEATGHSTVVVGTERKGLQTQLRRHRTY